MGSQTTEQPEEPGPSVAPTVRAVIFADGTSWGDPQWTQRLTRRRDAMQRNLEVTVAELSAALAQGLSTGEIVTHFEAALSSEQHAATDADERACIQAVRGIALKNLKEVIARADGTPISTGEVLKYLLGSFGSRLQALRQNGSNP